MFVEVKDLTNVGRLTILKKMSTKRKFEDNLQFEDVTVDPKFPSKIWLQFKLAKNEGIAQCNNCGSQGNLLKGIDNKTVRR